MLPYKHCNEQTTEFEGDPLQQFLGMFQYGIAQALKSIQTTTWYHLRDGDIVHEGFHIPFLGIKNNNNNTL